MKKTAVISEHVQDKPILIIDKIGTLGISLYRDVFISSSVVFVSEKNPDIGSLENQVFIPFRKKIPSIPNITYEYIYVLYNGEEEIAQLLSHFLKKAEDDKAKFIFICERSVYSDVLKNEILSTYHRSIFVVIGDIFGEGISSSSTINRFFYEAEKNGRIELSGMGMKKTYPVFIHDVIKEIEKISFATDSSRLLLLYPQFPPTELSLAHLFHKIDPLIRIDFTRKEEKQNTEENLAIEGEYLLEKKYPLQKKIKEVYVDENEGKSNKKEETSRYIHTAPAKKGSGISIKFFFLLFIIALILLPLVFFFSSFVLGVGMLQYSKTLLEKGDTGQAYSFSKGSYFFLQAAQAVSGPILFESSLLGKEEDVARVVAIAALGKDISLGELYLLDALGHFQKVFLKTSSLPKQDFLQGSTSLKNALALLQKIKTEDAVYASIDSSLSGIKQRIDSLHQIADLTANFIDLAPALLGFDEERKYLLLFQNNMELRPGGGFIGSYGILTLRDGTVKDFSINDVYDADGKLRGHVDPPMPIRRYLPSPHWYLRDSNFNIDFQKNASAAAYFLNLETGETVDGVIGVDLSMLQKIIKIAQPVHVLDYNETVTADTMFLIIQKRVETNFFPGSTQKKDFLRALMDSLTTTIAAKHISYLSFLSAINSSLEEKHILFAFPNPSIQQMFAVNGFSSAILDNRGESQTAVNDFLGISEANLGVNKANYYITREIHQDVAIDSSGLVRSRVTLLYTNRSDELPGGDYKNYIRVITPLGSHLESVEINGAVQHTVPAITDPAVFEAKRFTPPKGLEIETTQEEGKTLFGFLAQIPKKSQQTIIVTYTLSKKASLEEPVINYSNYVFKQPGTNNDPFFFSLSYPANYSLSTMLSGLQKKANSFELRETFLKDINIYVTLTKK